MDGEGLSEGEEYADSNFSRGSIWRHTEFGDVELQGGVKSRDSDSYRVLRRMRYDDGTPKTLSLRAGISGLGQ